MELEKPADPIKTADLKNILALDLGTKTGWAVALQNQILSGSESFKSTRFCGGGARFLKFQHFLNSLHQKFDLKAVYFEEVRRHLGVDAAHVYGGFLAHLTSWCEENKIPYQGVSVGIIKKFATGKGNASKEEVIEALKFKGFNPVDDNEADSLALLLWAQNQINILID